jgi:hypothetical protein
MDDNDQRGGVSKIYQHILIFKGDALVVEGAAGAATGGTWLQPHTALSFLLAARRLLDTTLAIGLAEIVRPIAYLQRHAFEVALKDVTNLAYSVAAGKKWLEAQSENRNSKPPEPETAKFEHRLPEVEMEAGAALQAIGSSLPDGVKAMVKRLSEIENKVPDRWRYSTVKDRKPSFPAKTRIPIGKIQDELESLFETVFVFTTLDDARKGDAPLFAQLVLEYEAISQRVGELGAEGALPNKPLQRMWSPQGHRRRIEAPTWRRPHR